VKARALFAVALLVAACSAKEPVAWPAEIDAKRLLSDTTWVWCSDNPGEVVEVGQSLGLATGSDDWTTGDGTLDFYRACTTAAEARGSIDLNEPATRYLAVARGAGYANSDEQILRTALEACETFDETGVTSMSVGVATHNVAVVLGQLGEGEFLAEVLVGAASATICPEHAEGVAAFG
jgi:hypothetical protein